MLAEIVRQGPVYLNLMRSQTRIHDLESEKTRLEVDLLEASL